MTDSHLQANVQLQDLQLGMARALLGKPAWQALPPVQRSGTAWLQAVIDGLCEISQRDPLTGVANRRQLLTVLERELDRVARSGDIALLLMLDVDHFKQVNDVHGHHAGDLVLQHLASTVQDCIRPMDTVARFGGEEFAVVLPACQPAYGLAVAERIRHAIEQQPIRISPVEEIHVTVSIGGAYALQWIRSTNELWIERADQQLYHAKDEGRNCVHIEQQPDSTVTAEEKSLLFGELPLASDAYAEEWPHTSSEPLNSTGSVN